MIGLVVGGHLNHIFQKSHLKAPWDRYVDHPNLVTILDFSLQSSRAHNFHMPMYVDNLIQF